MKKYLLIICGLAMIATLASCGNSNKGSTEYSNSYSQIDIPDTTTSETTKKILQKMKRK